MAGAGGRAAVPSAVLPWAWRGWTRYGGGALGDWVCHVIDPVFWALDLDMPTTIVAETDDYDPRKQGETFPSGSKVTLEFPAKGQRGPVKLFWYDGRAGVPRPRTWSRVAAAWARGPSSSANTARSSTVRTGPVACGWCPRRPCKPTSGRRRRSRGSASAWRDWLDAVRAGRQAGSPFEYGGRLSEIGLLGVIAVRLSGTTLHYDEHAMRFTNCDEGNKLLNPVFRSGWSL